MAAQEDLAAALGPRVRLVGTAAAVGIPVGALVAVSLLVVESPSFASRKAFAVGALLLGLGLLGWSGSIFAGDGFEAMQRHLDTGQGWSEQASRRAMARVGGFGAGWMVGVSVTTAVLA